MKYAMPRPEFDRLVTAYYNAAAKKAANPRDGGIDREYEAAKAKIEAALKGPWD